MAGLSLSIRTLRIRVSFYEIVNLHGGVSSLGPSWPEVVIPLNSHEIKRANIRAGSDTIFQKIFHVAKPAFNRSSEHGFSHGLSRPCAISVLLIAEYVMGVDPAALRFRERVQGRRGAPAL